jgi:hypothetical protein
MDNKHIIENCQKFIQRYGYTMKELVDCDYDIASIDYLNKHIFGNPNAEYGEFYSPKAYIVLCLHLAFWHSPACVLNFFKTSFTEYHNVELFNIIDLGDDIYSILTDNYSPSNIYEHFDVYTTFKKACRVLISKMFNEQDNWFGEDYVDNVMLVNYITLHEHNLLVRLCTNKGICVSGSLGMALCGTIYRSKIKDIDFVLSSDWLTSEINGIIDEEIDHNTVIGKHRVDIENLLCSKFNETRIYTLLKGITTKPVEVKKCCIDRCTVYDRTIKCCYIVSIDNKDYDFIVRDKLVTQTANCFNATINVQSVKDMIVTKKLLGRPKDYQDLKHYKLYQYCFDRIDDDRLF